MLIFVIPVKIAFIEEGRVLLFVVFISFSYMFHVTSVAATIVRVASLLYGISFDYSIR